MSFKCKIGLHSWDGCKCVLCGKMRDKKHACSYDCENCSRCGKTKVKQHDWSMDCEKCSKCERTRKNQHDWANNCEKCTVCGKIRHKKHEWHGCTCTICGQIRDESHIFKDDGWICSLCGKNDLVAAIKEEGIDLNKPRDPFLSSLIYIALNDKNIRLLKLLIAAGEDIDGKKTNTNPLYDAISRGQQIEAIKILLAAGADIEASHYIRPPICQATHYNCIEIVKLLISAGANIDGRDYDNPLLKAIEENYFELAEILIANNANVMAKTKYGTTPLHLLLGQKFSSEKGNLAVSLINHGASLEAQSNSLKTPIDIAEKNDKRWIEFFEKGKIKLPDEFIGITSDYVIQVGYMAEDPTDHIYNARIYLQKSQETTDLEDREFLLYRALFHCSQLDINDINIYWNDRVSLFFIMTEAYFKLGDSEKARKIFSGWTKLLPVDVTYAYRKDISKKNQLKIELYALSELPELNSTDSVDIVLSFLKENCFESLPGVTLSQIKDYLKESRGLYITQHLEVNNAYSAINNQLIKMKKDKGFSSFYGEHIPYYECYHIYSYNSYNSSTYYLHLYIWKCDNSLITGISDEWEPWFSEMH